MVCDASLDLKTGTGPPLPIQIDTRPAGMFSNLGNFEI